MNTTSQKNMTRIQISKWYQHINLISYFKEHELIHFRKLNEINHSIYSAITMVY